MTQVPVATERPIQTGEALLQVLRLNGVRAVFSSPGSEWPALWDALAAPASPDDNPVRFYNARHESLAVAMAAGYHKATLEPVAVALHSTVGLLHGAMAIQMALREGVPMVILSGDSNSWGLDPGFDPGYQWLRSLTATGGSARTMVPLTKWSEQVTNGWHLGEMLQQACRAATSPPQGPVFLGIPLEVLLGSVSTSALPDGPNPQPRHFPDPAALDRFADALLNARRPVIVTEAAGQDPANMERLVALADALGAAVVESLIPAYVNFPTDHPLHQGTQFGSVAADADLVLLLATRGPWHPPRGKVSPEAKVLLADEDLAKLGYPAWPYRVDDCVSGNISLTIQGLVDRVLASPPNAQIVAERRAMWAKRHQKLHETWKAEAEAARDRTPIDPTWLSREFGEALPADVVVTEELTTTRPFVLRYLPRVRAGSFIARMTGGLGVGMSTAVGLKIAHPDRPVVALVGDGAFNYNPVPACLGAMQEYDAPVLTIVVNNQSYASMKGTHRRLLPDGWAVKSGKWNGSAITPTPDYSALAAAFGGRGERVEDPRQIRAAICRAFEDVRSGRSVILDVIVAGGDRRQ